MKIFKAELHKIFIKENLLMVTIIAIILELSLVFISYQNSAVVLDKTELITYNSYTQQLKGSLDKAEDEWFISKRDKVNTALHQINNLVGKLEQGDPTTKNPEKLYDELMEEAAEYNVFQELQKQYLYVKEDTENRWFLNNYNTNLLFVSDSMNYITIILITLSVIYGFSIEKHSKVLSHIIVSKSCKKTIRVKIFITLAYGIGLILISLILKYSVFILNYGMFDLNSPIQSLTYFSTSQYHINIAELILCDFIFKSLGTVLISMVMISLVLYNVEASMMALLLISGLLIPEVLFVNESYKYLFLPLGLLKSIGFFKGNESFIMVNDFGENVIVDRFISIPLPILMAILAISASIIFILLVKSLARYENKLLKNIHIKNVNILLMILLAVPAFTACSGQGESVKIYSPNIYNNNYSVENKKQEYVLENNEIHIVTKETGDKTKLITDVFYDLQYQPLIYSLFLDENNLYYLSKLNTGQYRVVEVSLKDYKQKQIYLRSLNYEYKYLNSILAQFTDFSIYNNFFVDDDYVYFISDSGIDAIRKNTNEVKTIISDNLLKQIVFYRGSVFYINKKYCLVKYSLEGSKVSIISEKVLNFSISEDFEHIVYHTIFNGGNKYKFISKI